MIAIRTESKVQNDNTIYKNSEFLGRSNFTFFLTKRILIGRQSSSIACCKYWNRFQGQYWREVSIERPKRCHKFESIPNPTRWRWCSGKAPQAICNTKVKLVISNWLLKLSGDGTYVAIACFSCESFTISFSCLLRRCSSATAAFRLASWSLQYQTINKIVNTYTSLICLIFIKDGWETYEMRCLSSLIVSWSCNCCSSKAARAASNSARWGSFASFCKCCNSLERSKNIQITADARLAMFHHESEAYRLNSGILI